MEFKMKTQTTQKTVTIEVREVGQSFGCMSLIKSGKKTIWESRVFPYGFTANAVTAAENKIAAEGWVLAGKKGN